MKQVKNNFGTGNLYTASDLDSYNKVYVLCTACMSVFSDFSSYAQNNAKFSTSLRQAGAIVVLGCQVTDLAILNDIKTMERLHLDNPKADCFMGGCLAQRFDIKIPSYINRLDVVRNTAKQYPNINFIRWQKPFWVDKLDKQELSQGNLFRDMYPLKIGAGCHGKCKYCTIRDTRGETYHKDPRTQIDEFLSHENIVLVSDSPTEMQIKVWCGIALDHKHPISIRNVEPYVALSCKEELLELASNNLLKIFHCPIQSSDRDILKDMGRPVDQTLSYIMFAQDLRNLGVTVATNVIIDYVMSRGEKFRNLDEDWMNSHFDYWVWNPYFDGNWNIKKAEQRFSKYIVNQDF